jgi:hypothetical protein
MAARPCRNHSPTIFRFLRRRPVLPEPPDARQLTQARADRLIFGIRHPMQRDHDFNIVFPPYLKLFEAYCAPAAQCQR